MKVDIRITENFKKAAKKLLRKYPSLKFELLNLEEELQSNPKKGTPIGSDCFKIRLSVKSKGKGKSGGVRILTHIIVNLKIDDNGLTKLYMVYIYDKSEFESISEKELKRMIKDIKSQENYHR
jgi:mRNA-degrading endonuclease RelE of RelBE toxin-antitoxin system